MLLQNLMKQSKFIFVPDVMVVMLISRFVVQLYFLMEQVSLFAF